MTINTLNSIHLLHLPLPNRLKQLSILLFVLALTFIAQTQDNYPKNYFDPPLHRPMQLASSFAEIRANHFHSGLDLCIDKIGEPVYAPADGYVSRVNILSWGGGRMLYITHPNGYKTVYMHLDGFAGEIAQWVNDYQYSHHVYSFDTCPSDTIYVKKGQLIAFAGNSGGGGGPHLHYDIRLVANEQPINPLYFGLPYEDTIAPIIRGIKVYPAQEGGTINGVRHAVCLPAANKKKDDTITISGRFYVGIYATDISNGSPGKNGVESIQLFVDDSLYYHYGVKSFFLDETRAVNAIIDYPTFISTGQYYIITRQLRGLHKPYSQARDGSGYLLFQEGTRHKLEYVVSDYKGNRTTRTFFVRALMAPQTVTRDDETTDTNLEGQPVCYFKRNVLSRPNFTAQLGEGTLYDNDILLYSTSQHNNLLSGMHTIKLKRSDLPPNKNFDISMPLPQLKDSTQIKHLVIVSVKGNRFSALPTQRQGNLLTASTRYFGSFGITLDTIRPGLQAVNFKPGSRFKGNQLVVKIWDNLSGVASYHCYINDTWVLSQHDSKTACLYITPGDTMKTGKNVVRFVITDAAGNTRETSYTLTK
jgi:hypothetical protein